MQLQPFVALLGQALRAYLFSDNGQIKILFDEYQIKGSQHIGYCIS
jgi:hypothetical protein